jgi:plasmid maintenance system antidote protein VapI
MTHTQFMNIKEFLKAEGLEASAITNVKLAEIVGVSESTIKRELARNEKMDLDYIVAIVDHFGLSRTRTLKSLGVLDLDDLRDELGTTPTIETASQVEMLRELLVRAEESDPNVTRPTEFSDEPEDTGRLNGAARGASRRMKGTQVKRERG